MSMSNHKRSFRGIEEIARVIRGVSPPCAGASISEGRFARARVAAQQSASPVPADTGKMKVSYYGRTKQKIDHLFGKL